MVKLLLCKNSLWALLLCFSFMLHAVYAAQKTKPLIKAEKYTYTPRGLLILLDDTEQEIGALHQSLFTALSQKAGPIVVSTALLHKVLSEYVTATSNPSFTSKKAADLQEEYAKLYLANQPQSYKQLKAILLKAAAFTLNEWIIKEINESLTLLIPNDYLNSIKIDPDKVKAYNPGQPLTPTELALGIKVNNMNLVTNVFELIYYTPKPYEYADYFKKFLPDIFCTRKDYAGKNVSLPVWSLYMIGHGEKEKMVVAMRLKDFQEILDFFQLTINMRLLLYTSCFSAGTNVEKVYKENASELQKIYSFPIIMQVFTEVPASAWIFYPLVKDGTLKIETGFNLKELLRLVTLPSIINYENILDCIFPIEPTAMATKTQIAQSKRFEKIYWGNIPQIKLPGLEWFFVMATRARVPIAPTKTGQKFSCKLFQRPTIVQIGSIVTKTRSSDRPIDVVTYFKTEPTAILLQARNIPFEIKIKKGNLKLIASTIPGDVIHTIKKISSQTMDAPDIIALFMKLEKLDARKTFFINEISYVRNNKVGSITDVIITYQNIPTNKCYAYFTGASNKKYKIEAPGQEPEVASSVDDFLYQMALDALSKPQPAQPEDSLLPSRITAEEIEKIKGVLPPQLSKTELKKYLEKKKCERDTSLFEKLKTLKMKLEQLKTSLTRLRDGLNRLKSSF